MRNKISRDFQTHRERQRGDGVEGEEESLKAPFCHLTLSLNGSPFPTNALVFAHFASTSPQDLRLLTHDTYTPSTSPCSHHPTSLQPQGDGGSRQEVRPESKGKDDGANMRAAHGRLRNEIARDNSVSPRSEEPERSQTGERTNNRSPECSTCARGFL